VIAVTDPVYPVYVDTNVMAGHTGEAGATSEYAGLVYMRATADNGFSPAIPQQKVDVVYLCSPNNPTGATLTRPQLEAWVAYARKHGSILLFDAAYEAFITDPAIPHSIYEIPGATECAIEFRSFSKTAGFTGTRCAFTVVPKALKGTTPAGESVDLFRLWTRRHTTKFNGVSYIIQKGAEAVYSAEGKQQTRALIEHYLGNAKLIRESLVKAGLTVFGGVNAPYCWVQTPKGAQGEPKRSWDFFDHLLNKAHVVCTPGAGFGSAGEGYVRLSAFNSRANVEEAMKRVVGVL
jgi:LL-diaminopimelate aminotransferase